MILLAIGLPVWMVFSWVYEVTPEGVKKTEDVSYDLSVTATTNKRLNILIVIMLIMAVGVNFIDTAKSEKKAASPVPEEKIRENSIAVLPFLDMSPLKDQAYYSDGIAIEILNSLCKFKELLVVGQTSSFAFKNKEEDIKSIGQKLHVNNILEGSVQKQQDKIRISVRLTDAKNGYTLFSESYTDDLENIFELQTMIALDIAQKIESKLALEDNALYTRKKIDPRAYETFLKGKLQFVNGPLNMKKNEIFTAKKYFEQAVLLDGSFAEANAYLSLIYFNMADWALSGDKTLKRDMALDSAKILAKRAHALDSLSSGAHLAMGSYYFHEYDWIQAEKEKRRAVQLNPGGSEEKFMLASFLSQFDQPEEAIALSKEAIRLNPLDQSAMLKYIKVLYFSRRFEQALDLCQQLIAQEQMVSGAYQFMFVCYMGLQQYEKAGKALGEFLRALGDENTALLFFENDFKTAVDKLLLLHKTSPVAILDRNIYMANFYAFTENKEKTLQYLYATYNNKDANIGWMRSTWYEFLKDEPKYQALYEMAGFKAYDEIRNKTAIKP